MQQLLHQGDRVGILAYNRAEYVAAYLGAMRRGLVAVPMNIRLPQARLAAIAEEADIRLVFCDPDHAELLDGCETYAEIVRSQERGEVAA